MLEIDCTMLTPDPVLHTSGHEKRFSELHCEGREDRGVLQGKPVARGSPREAGFQAKVYPGEDQGVQGHYC